MNIIEFYGLSKDDIRFRGKLRTKSTRITKIEREIENKFNIKILECKGFYVHGRINGVTHSYMINTGSGITAKELINTIQDGNKTDEGNSKETS